MGMMTFTRLRAQQAANAAAAAPAEPTVARKTRDKVSQSDAPSTDSPAGQRQPPDRG